MEEQIYKLVQFASKYGYTAGDLLKQAECMDQYGVIMHQSLCVYSSDVLQKAAHRMENMQGFRYA